MDEKDNGQKNVISEIPDQQDKSVAPTKTFIRKKVPAGKIVQNEGTEDKPKDNLDPSSAASCGRYQCKNNCGEKNN